MMYMAVIPVSALTFPLSRKFGMMALRPNDTQRTVVAERKWDCHCHGNLQIHNMMLTWPGCLTSASAQ